VSHGGVRSLMSHARAAVWGASRHAYNAPLMCGIYGMTGAGAEGHRAVLDAMGASLRHRGPDGHADFVSDSAAIGTERLRIIDLHERADQPFESPDGAVWLEANGEIYNASALRARFNGYPFRSESDVEAILPLYLADGAAAVAQLDGMFGLAIWDSRTSTLLLARDRAGEKPLFYARVGAGVAFASEVQCLLEHPAVSRELDREAIDEYLALGYILEPRTPFRSIRRVPAGTYILFRGGESSEVRYWDPAEVAVRDIEGQHAVVETQRLIEQAVTRQVMSDVPVGVFISGGLDSSILAMLASQAIGVDKVHTFSAQFADASYDESGDAALLAKRMRTRHVPVRIDDETMLEALKQVTTRVAEPLSDPAILPTYLLAHEARRHVKVVLSGEGADELFGGYPTYLGHKLAPQYQRLPAPVRSAFSRIVFALPASRRKVTLEFLLKRFVTDAGRPWAERHLRWFGTGLGSVPSISAPGDDPLAAAMLLDYRSYLRDNLLVKVDRATMLSSVEARAPFLDRDVTAFALSLPSSLRVRGMTTKWVLKRAAQKWLPKEVIHRRKRGLSVPIAGWINGALRGEVDRLLDRDRLEAHGFVDTDLVRTMLAEHRSERANHTRALWAVVILEYWLERWT
jgi:asparagine synthase (glutamine-hydrolysing)